MPLKIPDNLPAIEILKKENIFIMGDSRANSQDIRPLSIAILNLMPLKTETETDLIRLLSNTPLQIEIRLVKLRSHTPKTATPEHMSMFYDYFDDLKERKFDGMIITGAPVETMPFEEVAYWKELCGIFDWTKTHITSTLHICWAAQAGLYYHYGIKKYMLKSKKFGVYKQRSIIPGSPIFRGFDDVFTMPQSRHTTIKAEDIREDKRLTIASESLDGDPSIIMARGGREFFVTGHLEYSKHTLGEEYFRDKDKRSDVGLPENYFKDDDSTKEPVMTWRAHANLFFCNWINYYLYQITPYDISTIE